MTTALVMSITGELLAELEEKAKAATPGRWRLHDVLVPVVEPARESVDYMCTVDTENAAWRENAQHIAAANPATLLALIAHIRSLEARLEKAERKMEMVGYFTFCHDNRIWKQGKPEGQEFFHLFTPLYAAIAQEGAENE